MKKEFACDVFFCLFELIAGIMLLLNPVGLTSWIIKFSGIALMAAGILDVMKYFRTDAKEASLEKTLAKGLLALLAGAFCLFKTEWFIVTFPVLTIIYGVVILMIGIGKIQLTVDMLRQKKEKWYWAAINAVVSIICAIVILYGPFPSTVALWIFTGATLIAEAVLDFITVFMGEKTAEN